MFTYIHHWEREHFKQSIPTCFHLTGKLIYSRQRSKHIPWNRGTQNINQNNSAATDNITGKILKEHINICSDILTFLFTQSIHSGKVPSDWNHTNVTPVFNKVDKHHPGNYRHMSLTCISCRLLVHILASKMVKQSLTIYYLNFKMVLMQKGPVSHK